MEKELIILGQQNDDFHQMSAQAVGGAVGHNEISIIIPCHRVVGCSNPLTKDFESKVLEKTAPDMP